METAQKKSSNAQLSQNNNPFDSLQKKTDDERDDIGLLDPFDLSFMEETDEIIRKH